ncbi:hypothetical protein D3C86_2191520 [compost metagenome]
MAIIYEVVRMLRRRQLQIEQGNNLPLGNHIGGKMLARQCHPVTMFDRLQQQTQIIDTQAG